jgi:methylphosphotriester-DNA--protein-cysteine methyltransferase
MGCLESNTKSGPAEKRAADATKKLRTAVKTTLAAAVAFAVGVEAAVADLEQRRPTGMGPLERALAARVRSAAAQFRACAQQVGEDGLMVTGSMGQERAHPLLKTVADLRGEIADRLTELTFRVEQKEMLEQMNTRRHRERTTTEEMAKLMVGALTGAERASGQ